MNKFERFFQLDTEWNTVHVPEKPNGFGLFLIGDRSHFVEDKSSPWLQNPGRKQMLQDFLDAGYTVFYSNLYGQHWGSEKAIMLAKRIIHVVQKQETLNEKIHIFAEGMGALAAHRLMEGNYDFIRSVVTLNPCISLDDYMVFEKENKFFYKQLIKELTEAYDVSKDELEKLKDKFVPIKEMKSTVVYRSYVSTSSKKYPYEQHVKRYEIQREKLSSPIYVSFFLEEKKYQIQQSFINFFKKNEKDL